MTEKKKFFIIAPLIFQKDFIKKGNVNIGVIVDTKRYNENDFKNEKEDFVDFVRITTHPNRIEETLFIVENIHKKDYTAMIQLMDMTKLEDEHYDILKKWEHKDILKTIYLADTYGTNKNKRFRETLFQMCDTLNSTKNLQHGQRDKRKNTLN